MTDEQQDEQQSWTPELTDSQAKKVRKQLDDLRVEFGREPSKTQLYERLCVATNGALHQKVSEGARTLRIWRMTQVLQWLSGVKLSNAARVLGRAGLASLKFGSTPVSLPASEPRRLSAVAEAIRATQRLVDFLGKLKPQHPKVVFLVNQIQMGLEHVRRMPGDDEQVA